MEFQLSHFKSWKMMHENAALNMPANLENSAVVTDWKRSVFIPIPKKGNARECSNYCTTALISHTSKVMLKILWARLKQYMNWELPDVQAGFRKGRAIRDQIANIHWIIEKAREFQKNICFIDYANVWTVWITTNCGKFLKRWEYQTTWPVSWEICMQVKKQQSELDMEQWTGSKLGKEYVKAIYCHPAYLASMLNSSSAGIPPPPLALFIVMLPKVHLTLYSMMSGSMWTPSWLSGSLRSFYIAFLCILAISS